MNESEWKTCDDPEEMVIFLEGRSSDRKLRLFACAFCRSIWRLLDEDCFRNAVEVAERFADGQATRKELDLAKRNSGAILEKRGREGLTGTRLNAKGCAWSTTRNAGSAAMYPLWVFTSNQKKKLQLELLRDIFGNPFRIPKIDSAWLTPRVEQLARGIYEKRRFKRLPELADALEEAGCEHDQILDHCRHPGPHVRGCWVVDLLLRKS